MKNLLSAIGLGLLMACSAGTTLRPIGEDFPYQCKKDFGAMLQGRLDGLPKSSAEPVLQEVVKALPDSVAGILGAAIEQSGVDPALENFSSEQRSSLRNAVKREFARSYVCGGSRSDVDIYLIADAISVVVTSRGFSRDEVFRVNWVRPVDGQYVDLEEIMVSLALAIVALGR